MFRLLLRFRVCFTVVSTCGLYDVFGNRPTDSFHVFSSLWNLGMYGKGFGGAATMGRHIWCAIAEFANFKTKFEDHRFSSKPPTIMKATVTPVLAYEIR